MSYIYKYDTLDDQQVMSIEQIAQKQDLSMNYLSQKEEVIQFMMKLERLPDHAKLVADLSLQLFDQLQTLHGCSTVHRKLLEFSAILHDIGWSISGQKHHKHSMRLIQNHNFEYLHYREQLLIAQIARYHRKGKPKKNHSDFSNLNPDERQIIQKMASLLRLADALDRNKKQWVQNIECKIVEDQFVIVTDCLKDLTEEYEAIERKKNLFEDTYQLSVQLEQQSNINNINIAVSC